MRHQLGTPRLHYRSTESTNDIARGLATAGAPSGLVVTADEQTAGRGRQGRRWLAPADSALLMSALVRPVEPEHRLAPLVAALAVAETCEALTDVKAQIKWPNDIWIDRRKVAGILVEARPDQRAEHSWLVIGIGLNTSLRIEEMPQELREIATTLGLPPGSDALGPLLERLDHWLAAPADQVIKAWNARDALRGREVAWDTGDGIGAGVDDQGNLLVRGCGGGVTTLRAGEVHLKRR